jgi:hypothetical protein
MEDDILMYIATAFYLLCYIPTVYADVKNANCNVYNLPERLSSICGTTFGLAYGLRINNTSIVVNYGCHIGLELATLVIKCYYAYLNGLAPAPVLEITNRAADAERGPPLEPHSGPC